MHHVTKLFPVQCLSSALKSSSECRGMGKWKSDEAVVPGCLDVYDGALWILETL